MSGTEPSAVDLTPSPPPERPTLLVCECGVIATGWAAARCGRNGVRNIRLLDCPARYWTYELVPADEQAER